MKTVRKLLPPTTQRVFIHTKPKINKKILHQTIRSLDSYKHSNNKLLTDRIKSLNSEWDTERFLEANAASVVVLSTLLGLKSNKYWFFLTGAVGLFLLQHALQGWCPPLPFIRKMGVRTAQEINNEKTVLKMLRKDFVGINRDDVMGMYNIAKRD